ncbi:hypothetical protein Zmor_004345, partial [Zophobas morio]
VRVISARDLPIMDKSTESTDAFVEVKFNDVCFKTSVCRKTLCPTWNTDFRFEVEDAEIQNDILEIKIYDHDSYSANDAIGKVYIDLSPLTMTNGPTLLQGWHPIYDTLRGIRGEINLIVKLHFFNNENKFRDTSIGVKIFALNEFPSCYSLIKVHSFVEELVVSTDPEYQWVDNFRSNRASNDARVRLLYRLTGSLKRKLGLKALDLGGNAIVGYLQDFDIEGEYGLVARGIGTVVTLQEFEPAMASQGPALLLFQDPARAQCKGSLNRSGQGDLSVHRFYSHHLKSVFPFYTLSHWPSSVIHAGCSVCLTRPLGSQLGSLLIESLCVEASVCRAKKKLQGESNAIVVSEVLPFIEYELHRQLLNKLKLHAMNAIFGLSVQISISESVISALAVGTAVFIKSLPLLPPIKISRSLQVLDEEDQKLVSIQKKCAAVYYNSSDADSKTDSSDENISENIALELAKRRSLALEIDDEEDEVL